MATQRPAAKRPAAKRSRAKSGSTARRRIARPRSAAPRAGLLACSSWRTRIAVIATLLVALAGGYAFWLRDSSLVAVTDVEVVGVTTSDRAEIVSALTGAAEEMTTLNSDEEKIAEVAARFPTVAAVDVDPNFPHGMRLEVRQRPPRLLAGVGERQIPVAADGTVLTGLEVPEDVNLPELAIEDLPAAGRLEGAALEQALIVGAAPDPLLGLIERIDRSDELGVELVLRGGVQVRFGSGARAAEKWAAAAAVLADPKLDVVRYVDVRVPERPAAA